MTDEEFLAQIKKMASECRHGDSAAGLVYFINNTVGATGPGCWRSWDCKPHYYGGNGPINMCPVCLRLDKLDEDKSG